MSERDGDFVAPRDVVDADDCHFYHTIELPNHGLVHGPWDLRTKVDAYLGHFDFRGKRVLDIGTATGFLAFSAEQRGAEVIAYDLSEEEDWDIVPYAGEYTEAHRHERRAHIRRLNDGFWFCRNALGSGVRLATGSVYAIPPSLGPVDVSVLGCVLLHLRDPFRALQAAASITQETMIVVERPPNLHMVLGALRMMRIPIPASLGIGKPSVQFLPDHRKRQPTESWWRIPPRTLIEFLAVLGFGDVTLNYHVQRYDGKPRVLYTVTARRTRGDVG